MGERPSLAVGAALAHLAPPIWSYERAFQEKKETFYGKQELVASSKAALKVATLAPWSSKSLELGFDPINFPPEE